LLELLDARPFVDHDDEAVADPEPVMNRADGPGPVGDLGELVGPIGQSLAELAGVALEFPDDQHPHVCSPSQVLAPGRREGVGRDTSPGWLADHRTSWLNGFTTSQTAAAPARFPLLPPGVSGPS